MAYSALTVHSTCGHLLVTQLAEPYDKSLELYENLSWDLLEKTQD